MILLVRTIDNFIDETQKLKETNLAHQYIYFLITIVKCWIKNIQTFINLLNFIEGIIILDSIWRNVIKFC